MKKPRSLSRSLTLVAPTVALTVSSSDAAVDAFLKIDGIDGESQAEKRGGWVELGGVSYGFRRPLSVTNSGVQSAGAAAQDAFVITKILDKASPPLALRCLQGVVIPTVTLEFVRAGGATSPEPYYRVILTDVMVSSFTHDQTAADVPTEEVSFNYTKVEIEYFVQDGSGKTTGSPVTAVYDFSASTK